MTNIMGIIYQYSINTDKKKSLSVPFNPRSAKIV